MRFKEGDKVEFIDQGELKQGVVTEIKASNFDISYLMTFDEDNKIIWVAEDLLLSPAQVLKVPQFVADWYEQHRHKLEYSIWGYIYDWDDQDCESDFYDFMENDNLKPVETLIKMKDGYEVEKEPLYYVRLPLSTWNDDAAELEVINMYVLLNKQSDETTFTGLIINKNKKWTTKLTEAEIKGMPGGDIYWQFAVLVEELEE
ncbi:hypothetical protein HS43_07625 [Listeria monocytogenes]|uniref:DUF1642 domain-containing protein n=2 Tax=Listeria monocytogenes TaxID=1639 RepID=A0A5L7Y9A5_LISMN|nr:DUF1642 domain-containing protein [Listeria monocytogenes]EAD6954674.1 DUF1642 domain-containing protein [Listeria monocytogenes]EAH4203747.1 DUF1642 domain-containing protein [Listeria monocytogenes]EAH4212774.1 DUF1642 domain-containing protein [Listeria monocytogenes]EAH4224946.1 DUF1642 domain-containing protein [Listeria monocytogenes]EAK9704300.1 DUF1642 domain-containing protein [Listeria monocytogenes]